MSLIIIKQSAICLLGNKPLAQLFLSELLSTHIELSLLHCLFWQSLLWCGLSFSPFFVQACGQYALKLKAR